MSSLTYKDSGVDITKGNQLIDKIKPIAKSTLRPGVLAGLGGFGAMFEIPLDRYKNPVLISGTDGVGTKLMVAEMLKKHDTIGIDLVAMCVNCSRCRAFVFFRLLCYGFSKYRDSDFCY